jgi:hypothetical protein
MILSLHIVFWLLRSQTFTVISKSFIINLSVEEFVTIHIQWWLSVGRRWRRFAWALLFSCVVDHWIFITGFRCKSICDSSANRPFSNGFTQPFSNGFTKPFINCLPRGDRNSFPTLVGGPFERCFLMRSSLSFSNVQIKRWVLIEVTINTGAVFWLFWIFFEKQRILLIWVVWCIGCCCWCAVYCWWLW